MNLHPIKSYLRWHLLDAIISESTIHECMAAATDDGIGVIARWVRNEDGSYRAEAMDTESSEWDPVGDDEGENVTRTPPFEFAQSERQRRAAAIIKDILVNHLPRIQEGLEKGYVDENQILVIYDHAVRCRILTEHND